jgi:xanthine dehydrogenase accessory factor
MFNDYIKHSQRLLEQGRPFVVALVVNYKAPISGKPGDRAIVTDDGELWGWVAGGCSQGIIVEQALSVLRSGSPKMIRITPEPDESNDEIMKHKMTCHSGGTLDVYLEPVIPQPQVVILGTSAVAEKMGALGQALGYQILTRLDITKLTNPENTFIVVSTQGDGDESALEQALAFRPAYLGFVASKKKAEAVKNILSDRGISDEQLSMIKAPAGLDIKARSPGDIALSIYAEIVMTLQKEKTAGEQVEPPEIEKALDPICGMQVTIENAKHILDHRGTKYYFCCEGCKDTFSREPEKYIANAK